MRPAHPAGTALIGLLIVGVVVVMAAAGCARHAHPTTSIAVSQPLAGDHGDTPEDICLAQAIRQALRTDPAIPGLATAISISVSRGFVELAGTVPLASDKAEIGVQARWMAGLDRVQNSIAISPASGR